MKTFKLLLLGLGLGLFSTSTYAQIIGTGREEGATFYNVNVNFKIPLSGLYTGVNSTTDFPDQDNSAYQHIFVMRHSNLSNNNQIQIIGNCNNNDRMFFRKFSIPTLSNSSNLNVWNEFATRGANTFTGNQTISGNVGIGTTTPEATLHVDGTTRFDHGVTVYALKPGMNLANTWTITNNFPNSGQPGIGLQFWRNVTGPNDIKKICTMHLGDNGFVGIGTTEPDYMLTVKGTIHAREVKVNLDGPLADYVFDKNYKLMDLKDVESYVNEHSHLPEVPSATEVANNGMDLGEMQNKMLQKIEELTLYVIKQQKEIDELKKK